MLLKKCPEINMDQAGTLFQPTVLIAPLDWGLGHATRCIPIIHSLIKNNCNVKIACNEKIKSLLSKEFPQLDFIHLKGYEIRYSKNKWSLPLHIGKQIPKILATIQYENERLQEIVKEHNVHGIISDNRYGFYHKNIPSVFITHQLRIQTPFGKLANSILQRLNYKLIEHFKGCWIPDNEGEMNLAGELSHPSKKPSVPIHYLGPLSRFQKQDQQNEKQVLILLSGPEPQRTILETLLIEQLNDCKEPIVFVRGLPDETKKLNLSSNISVYNHLPAEELNKKMNEATVVIGRCGYSTIMDLAALKKKSILIPTPGQTEQEYLSKHLMKNNFALCIEQKKFKLKNALALSKQFNYQIENFSSKNNLDAVIENFISTITNAFRH